MGFVVLENVVLFAGLALYGVFGGRANSATPTAGGDIETPSQRNDAALGQVCATVPLKAFEDSATARFTARSEPEPMSNWSRFEYPEPEQCFDAAAAESTPRSTQPELGEKLERVPLTSMGHASLAPVGTAERAITVPAALACVPEAACQSAVTTDSSLADGSQEHMPVILGVGSAELAVPVSDKSGPPEGEPVLKPHRRLPAIVAPNVPLDATVAPNIPLRQFPAPETLGRQAIPAFRSLPALD